MKSIPVLPFIFGASFSICIEALSNYRDVRSLPSPNAKLKNSLDTIGLGNVLKPTHDLGYYGWSPSGSYRELSSVTAQEIQDCVDLSILPPRLLPLKKLNRQLPWKFGRPKPFLIGNRYPFGQTTIASLFVASQRSSLDDVDFVFGSYTLQMLATGKVDSLVVARIPGTQMVLATRHKLYTQNYNSMGMQFERFVVGESLDTLKLPSIFESVDHLQKMQVGPYTALLSGEIDALDRYGYPVEVKASGPNFWTLERPFFQMVGAGTPRLCSARFKLHGRRYTKLSKVHLYNMKDVADITGVRKHAKVLARNIEQRIVALKDACDESLENGEVLEVCIKNTRCILRPSKVQIGELFPCESVVSELLQSKAEFKQL